MDEAMKIIQDKLDKSFSWNELIDFGKLRDNKFTYKKYLQYHFSRENFAQIHAIVRQLMNSPSTQYTSKKSMDWARTITSTMRELSQYSWLFVNVVKGDSM
jgi:hypothetical protein